MNLGAAYPNLNMEERSGIAKRVFRNFGRTGAEFLRAQRLPPEAVDKMMEIENLSIVDEALAAGKGVIVITAHFGNWELMARHLTDKGYSLCVVARDANDSRTNKIVNEIRRENGYEVLSRGNAARFVLGKLRKNEIVGILPDQNAGDIFVPFFGMDCGSVSGPAIMHIRTGAPIIPAFCVRLPDNRHRVEIKPPLDIRLTGDTQADTRTIMTQVQSAIEQQIRSYPDQWLWFHDRWKAARKRQSEMSHAG